jgi:hypothetical protein
MVILFATVTVSVSQELRQKSGGMVLGMVQANSRWHIMKNVLLLIVVAALAVAGCRSADNNNNGANNQVQPTGQMQSPPPMGGGGAGTPSTGTP